MKKKGFFGYRQYVIAGLLIALAAVGTTAIYSSRQEKEREQGNDHNKKQDAYNKNSRKNWNIAYFQQHPPKKNLFPAESSSRQKKSIYGAKKHHSPKKAKTDRQKIKILRHIHPKQEIRSNHHGQHGYLLHGMVRLLFLYAEL